MSSMVLANSPFLKILSERIQNAFEARLIDLWVRREINLSPVYQAISQEAKPLTLKDLQGIFIMLIILNLISICVFLWEVFSNK